jgi:RHS repeat-associated protein
LNYIRHTDWLGSSRLATTWAHAVYSKEAYAPFGETYNEAGTPGRSFTGQDQDVATGPGGAGVYDFLFRKYDPSAGRWLSPDPYGWGAVDQTAPQSLNRYAYVMNNPMNAVDPLGLVCISSDGSYDNSYDGPAAGCNGYYVQGFIGDGGMSYGEGMNQAINSPEYHFGYNTPPYQITGVNFAGNVSSGYSGYSGYYVIHSSGFDPNTGNIIIATNEYTYSDPSTAQWFYNTLANQSGATNGPGAPNNGNTIRAVTHTCIALTHASNVSGAWAMGDLKIAAGPFGLGQANTIIANRTGFNIGVSMLGGTAMEYISGIGETFAVAAALEGGFSWVTGKMANDACSYTPTNP